MQKADNPILTNFTFELCLDCDLEFLTVYEYRNHRERLCKALKKMCEVEESASAVANIQFDIKAL